MTVSVYRPEYNPETRKYEDINPIPPRAKGFYYRCLCTHVPKTITKSSDFTLHFKSKTHRDYVENYELNTRDVTDANERIKQLQIMVEMKHRRILLLERTLNKTREMHPESISIDYQRNIKKESD